jgi:hypothetical protein
LQVTYDDVELETTDGDTLPSLWPRLYLLGFIVGGLLTMVWPCPVTL